MMKRMLLAAAAALGVAMPAQASDDRLVTVVTAPDPQTQLMAMVLTMQAVRKGVPTHVLLCGPGGDLALADPPAAATAAQPPRGMSPQGLLREIMTAGATVEVCAIYLPGRGAAAETLLPGIGVAMPPAMAGAMLGNDTMVWSF